MLRIGFVTLFPDMIRAATGDSILRRASDSGLVEFAYANPRDFTPDKHRTVDDSPYGGGPGMLMKPEPVAKAVESLGVSASTICILPDPVGPLFTQADANALASASDIIFICGHYEGIDARVAEHFLARPFSIGDFVVTGGELPAALMADAIVRRLPGALGNAQSLTVDSHADGLLSAPQFTRPEEWRGLCVPDVLLSGHHAEVAKWRRRESLRLTRVHQPELLQGADLSKADLALLRELDEI